MVRHCTQILRPLAVGANLVTSSCCKLHSGARRPLCLGLVTWCRSQQWYPLRHAGSRLEGDTAWRAHWQPPLLAALTGRYLQTATPAGGASQAAAQQGKAPPPAAAGAGVSPAGGDSEAAALLRGHVSTYALPPALKLDPGSLATLVDTLLRLPDASVQVRLSHMPLIVHHGARSRTRTA